ncbi:MAG: CehA/McbA family metallohydrolase [Oscillospiraceae bacterium]|nr:CehA/McbA family metallohydrolase [Oscillospiraceae bacterium]
MRKELISDSLNQYKANLHCHSTYSDGCFTPEQIKEHYKSHGYHAVAFTDHDIFVPHDELRDEDFIPLHGYEIEVDEEGEDYNQIRTCHLCCVALDENIRTPVCLHHSRYMFAGALTYFHEMAPFEGDYVRSYDPKCINDIISKAKEAGFFVTYNHPVWSMENYPQYSQYRGMDAVEMFNYLSIVGGLDEYNHQIYEDLLLLGLDLGCTGNDDNHNSDREDPGMDSCGAWTMLAAPELSYASLADALKNGNYYASMGPSILSLYVEDGVVHVRTSDAVSINFSTGIRHTARISAKEGETVNEGRFSLRPQDGYFRVMVEDATGKRAYSRGYRLDRWGLLDGDN